MSTPAQPPGPPPQGIPTLVSPEAMVPRFATEVGIHLMQTSHPGGERSTQHALMEFNAMMPGHKVCVARIALTREAFAGLVNLVHRQSGPGGSYADLVDQTPRS